MFQNRPFLDHENEGFWLILAPFGIKLEPFLGLFLVPFRAPFWDAKVAETQGIQRVFCDFCTRKGDRFGALFGTIPGPFLVHFGRFLGNPPDSQVLERFLAARPSPKNLYKGFYKNSYKKV